MSTNEQKKDLWSTICHEHPEFGTRLQEVKRKGGDYVEVEGYPRKTTQWIEAAIQGQAPELGEYIEKMLKPLKEDMKMFDPQMMVEVTKLVDALIEHESEQAKMARKAG